MQVGLCFSVVFSGRLKHSHSGYRKRDYCERRLDVSKSIFCLETAVRKVVDPHVGTASTSDFDWQFHIYAINCLP